MVGQMIGCPPERCTTTSRRSNTTLPRSRNLAWHEANRARQNRRGSLVCLVGSAPASRPGLGVSSATSQRLASGRQRGRAVSGGGGENRIDLAADLVLPTPCACDSLISRPRAVRASALSRRQLLGPPHTHRSRRPRRSRTPAVLIFSMSAR